MVALPKDCPCHHILLFRVPFKATLGGFMAHLENFRIGWENEHLAAYLLSRISFIANPVTIGDDIGSDFFCTLFEKRLVNERRQLFPLRSFAIQIKSTHCTYPFDNKIAYLNSLEIPFFLGILQQDDLSLSIYSGQFLPMMFTHLGVPSRLTLCPVLDETLAIDEAYTLNGTHCNLKLPFLERLSVKDSHEEFDSKREVITRRCARMQANISTKIAEEYIYQLDDMGGVHIQAGSGSAKTYKRNLYLRLAEAFYNLEWIMNSNPDHFDREEFELYANFHASLRNRNPKLPFLINEIECRIRNKLNTKEKMNT
jgi:hypothetical protein